MKSIVFICCVLFPFWGLAQDPDYNKIYAYCLDGNVAKVWPYLSRIPDTAFVHNFESRFKYEQDQSDYLLKHASDIDPLLAIFHQYWRKSLLDTSKNYETALIGQLAEFFGVSPSLDTIQPKFNEYIKSKHLYTTDGIGKVGRLYDLLVWREQTDTVYTFNDITVKVTFMQHFVSLGWEDYATLGKHYPGGWATDSALYCVSDAYDKSSEKFLISYLAHEGRHFKDYKLFPHLESKDLEYRAKLTELSMAHQTLYELIQFFINNANKDSKNGHNQANYMVISGLSQRLFRSGFQGDIDKWKQVPVEKINKTANQLLGDNTKLLMQKKGA